MAHVHLPDGTFSIQWVIIWWILAIIILGLCLYWLKKIRKIDNNTITLAAMLTAASFAIFQVSIPLFGGVHINPVSYTHLRAHETRHDLVCRLLLEKKKQ